MNILDKIIEAKKVSIEHSKKALSFQKVKEGGFAICNSNNSTNSKDYIFYNSIAKKASLKQNAIIAEIKKASPSAGIIRDDFDVKEIAKSYEASGASALSILTEEEFFQGSPEYINQAKQVCGLPILRKDFIIDEYQIYETKLIGADCILLIVASLTEEELKKFSEISLCLGLSVLVEVHNDEELETALKICPPREGLLLGVNNRNLKTLEIDLQNSINMKQKISDEYLIVAESGIKTRKDILRYNSHNIYSFLIGESFMKQADAGQALAEVL